MKKQYFTSQTARKKKIGGGPRSIRKDVDQYLYTKGKEYTAQDGVEYIGEYYIGQDGNTYQGSTASAMSNPLKNLMSKTEAERLLLPYYEKHDPFVYDKLLDKNLKNSLKPFTTPTHIEYEVQADLGVYKIGYDTRFFMQKRGTNTWAVEVNSSAFERIGTPDGPDPGLYAWTSIQWQLVGTFDFIEKANKKAVTLGSQDVPGIPYMIRNYTQGASITKQKSTNYSELLHRRQQTPEVRQQILFNADWGRINSYKE